MAPSVSYFEVIEVGSYIFMSFSNQNRLATRAELTALKANLVERGLVDFPIAPGDYSSQTSPWFNLDVFLDQTSYTFTWNLNDPSDHKTLLDSLNYVKEFFATINWSHNVDPVLSAIRLVHSSPALLRIGNETYNVEFSSTNQVFEPDQLFKSEVSKKIREIEAGFSSALSHLKTVYESKLMDSHVYKIDFKEAMNGWRSFTYMNTNCLGLLYTYHPKWVKWYRTSYALKQQYQISQPGILIYVPPQSTVCFVDLEGKPIITPHTTSSSTGKLCTGSVSIHPALSDNDARNALVRIADAMTMINMDSLASYTFGSRKIDDKFIKECCEPQGAPIESEEGGSICSGEINELLSEGVI